MTHRWCSGVVCRRCRRWPLSEIRRGWIGAERGDISNLFDLDFRHFSSVLLLSAVEASRPDSHSSFETTNTHLCVWRATVISAGCCSNLFWPWIFNWSASWLIINRKPLPLCLYWNGWKTTSNTSEQSFHFCFNQKKSTSQGNYTLNTSKPADGYNKHPLQRGEGC